MINLKPIQKVYFNFRLMILFICAWTVFANTEAQFKGFLLMNDVAAYNARMDEISKTTTSIESDFVQKKVMSVLSESAVSKGHFIFKKPNRIRWEYIDPYQYLIIINNDKIFIKNDKKENEYDLKTSKAFQKVNRIMSGLLQGDVQNIKKDFNVDYFENDNQYLVNLTPKSFLMKSFFQNIEIYFDKKDSQVSQIRINEPSGDYTDIEFLKRTMNIDIPDDKFIIAH
jgi:outer membrane lipoprotein-sorting protein